MLSKTEDKNMHSAPASNPADPIESSFHNLNFIWLEITRKCNLECVHCYAGSAPSLPLRGAMTYSDWRLALEDAFSVGCRAVQFIGGEPTLHPDLPQLIKDAKASGYHFIEVFTNGTVLTPSLIDLFVQCNVRLATSVYATDCQTHDAITGREGSFNKTITGIRLAVERGLPIRAGVIDIRSNHQLVDNTTAMLRELGVESVGSDRVRGIGRGNQFTANVFPDGELCGACGNGKLAIDADGNVFPCVFSKFCSVGNARTGIGSALNSIRLRDFRASMKTRGGIAATACGPDTCYPQTQPCNPDCAPSSQSCVPQLRRVNIG